MHQLTRSPTTKVHQDHRALILFGTQQSLDSHQFPYQKSVVCLGFEASNMRTSPGPAGKPRPASAQAKRSWRSKPSHSRRAWDSGDSGGLGGGGRIFADPVSGCQGSLGHCFLHFLAAIETLSLHGTSVGRSFLVEPVSRLVDRKLVNFSLLADSD